MKRKIKIGKWHKSAFYFSDICHIIWGDFSKTIIAPPQASFAQKRDLLRMGKNSFIEDIKIIRDEITENFGE